MSLASSAANGAAKTLLGQASKFVIQGTTLVVLARLLSPHDYGVIAMVYAIVGIATVLGDLGLSTAAIQARVLTVAQKTNLFWLNALIAAISTGLICAAAPLIAQFYSQPELTLVTISLSSVFLLNGLGSQFRAELARELKFGALAVMDVTAQLSGLIGAILLAVSGAGYWALVVQQIAFALVTLVVSMGFSRWRPGLPSRNARIGRLVSFGASTAGVQLATYISNNVDSVAVGKIWGPTPLGFYNRAFQAFTLPVQQLAAPMTRVALPILSRLDNDADFQRYVERAQLFLCYGLIGAFGVSAAIAQPLFTIAYGIKWTNSVPIFQVLALGGVFQALAYVYYWIFLARGLSSLQLRYSILGRAVMVCLIIAGAQLGPLGAAIGYSSGLVVIWLLYTVAAVSKARVRVRPLLHIAVTPCIVFAVLFVACQAVGKAVDISFNQFALLGIQLSVCVAVLAAALIVRPFRRQILDLWRIARMVHSQKF